MAEVEAVSPAALLGAAGAVRATQADEAMMGVWCGFTMGRDTEYVQRMLFPGEGVGEKEESLGVGGLGGSA